ncbi:alpha/beta-hydrolase [Aspergillus homomorphus CBS 101889]|uniref:Alpha/beta-hydrolase n=1 Tax=Aspergillus homomorphus (strain CBS 101889) TaxID=1450537 RepID=A0A395I1F4_ASPHC|nr:alpha/beta-hydrolase [Aspergillus homomorphus CBS 101889]RAL13890.1 alpha/beta-hydrolase [Aspergillus homomorphus CBS 101889]
MVYRNGLIWAVAAAVAPAMAGNPNSVTPPFAVLVENNLDLSVEHSPSFLLLSKPTTAEKATIACTALQEDLVPSNNTHELHSLLFHYDNLMNTSSDSTFWLQPANGICYSYNRLNGTIKPDDCEHAYQGICTNTAPFQRNVQLPATNKAVVVNTTQGLVHGFRDRLAARFQGIPYAKPPVGHRRLQNPERLDHLHNFANESAYDATRFKPICPQDMSNNPGVKLNMTTSEDCLYLNVYTPSIPAGNSSLLPVLFWIHGGSYCYGGSSFPYYLGMNIASRQSMVVVSVNYRLGALGWLTEPKPSNSSMIGTNQAMRDQLMALEWVQQHIAAYGGDPTKVTILGESAGGSSVMSLLQTPAAKGQFSHAIVESGNTLSGWQRPEIATALSELFLNITGCPDYGCVKCNLTTSAMLAAQDRLFTLAQEILPRGQVCSLEPLRPFIDGDLLHEDWNTALQAGRYTHVPTLVTYNHDEYGLFLQENSTFTHTAANFSSAEAYLATFLLGEERTQAVLSTPELGFTRAALANHSDIDTPFVNFTTNYWYRCNGELYAGALAQNNAEVWELTWEVNVPEFIPGRLCGAGSGRVCHGSGRVCHGSGRVCHGSGRVCHGSELPLIFGSAAYDNISAAVLTETGYWDRARRSVDLYARFARKGRMVDVASNGSTVFPPRGGNETHYVIHWRDRPVVRAGGVNWGACKKMEEMRLYDRLYYPYTGPVLGL